MTQPKLLQSRGNAMNSVPFVCHATPNRFARVNDPIAMIAALVVYKRNGYDDK